MRALVLGARGAVGRVVVSDLRAGGHSVTPAGRTPSTGSVRIDLTASDGGDALRAAAVGHDVVVNASGVEDPRIAAALGGATLVEISATAGYLDALARAAPAGSRMVLGAGLVPGLSTIILAALDAGAGDELDLGVVLGGGEDHGAAAVAWTAGLAGRALHDPPEGRRVLNFRESRELPTTAGRRRLLRADFPDHLLLGRGGGFAVRSYLGTDSRLTTAALAAVGFLPALRRAVAYAPHVGGSGWSISAVDRRTGRGLIAHGDGQSLSTGILTSRMAAAAAAGGRTGVVTAADVLSLDDLRRVPGVRIALV
ncbi:hypothetical protein [Microbacterium marinilacus]|uniref:Saccharopine dehydrogenase n=1 Tax=Microbacterium marinilacus TaxID=415209 RepID=A0ABP7B2L7_9MICO|nr:hypothetical protein [Microbacterium marinilacus]MBY0688664.1 hypothetical protein [Microbacterium marinilacus]